MKKDDLKTLSVAQLKAKAKNHKVFIGIFIPIIAALFFFGTRDYFDGGELDWSTITIAICTLGGPATLYPELNEIQTELRERN